MAKAREPQDERQSDKGQSSQQATPEQSSARSESSGGQGNQQTALAGRGSRGLSQWGASPFTFMRRFSEEMDRLFDDFWGEGRMLGSGGGLFSRGGGLAQSLWSPQIEMFERGNQIVVRADLPGLSKDDVKVEFADDRLTIEGERRQEHEEGRPGEARYRSERSYGRFYRSIDLPEGVNPENANATFRDGVLEITLSAPKREEPRGRRIEIQS
jgi:HSP20 family protein